MRILVVEDDENKRSRILEYLRDHQPESEVLCAKSLVAGLREAKRSRPELVLLDMTLPNYDIGGDLEGEIHQFGGREYLRQSARRGSESKVIVLTQFESFGDAPNDTGLKELDAELRERFPDIYLGAVYYHASIDDWMEQLNRIIATLGLD